MVSDILNVKNSMARLEFKAVEMEPIVSGEFIVVEVDSNSELFFVDVFFAFSAGASVRFGILNFEILP